jgi:hypothetical protein
MDSIALRALNNKNPILAMGFVLTLVAFTNVHDYSLHKHPSYILAGIGGVLLVFGIILQFGQGRIRARQEFSDPVFYDALFWHELFKVMPPAFVKEVKTKESGKAKNSGKKVDTKLGEEFKQIARNEAFKNFQGDERPGSVGDKDRKLITGDHDRGDELASKQGESLFLELSDSYGMNPAYAIVTRKTAIEHHGRKFIVGWFVPVKLPETLDDGEVYHAKATGHQVTFGLLDAPSGEAKNMKIGRAARKKAESS